MIKQMGELEKLPINRYQAVMIASKRARALNQKLKRQKEAAMITPDLVEPEIDEKVKITVQAMQDLVENKIKYREDSSRK
jgi:DNA-directed RNA polymerase subunit K/omega